MSQKILILERVVTLPIQYRAYTIGYTICTSTLDLFLEFNIGKKYDFRGYLTLYMAPRYCETRYSYLLSHPKLQVERKYSLL